MSKLCYLKKYEDKIKRNQSNNTNGKEILFRDESYKIIGACYEVYNDKGNGFLEAVYQECLWIEFRNQKIPFIEKPVLELEYKGEKLTQTYQPNFICYNEIILELKAMKTIAGEHRAQVTNYLKATGKRLGVIINFGHFPKLESERIVL